MTSVLLAGVAVLDFVFKMDEFPRTAEKYRATGAQIVGGGNAANSAVAIARLGGTAHLASRLGDDQIADLIISDLSREGVTTDRVKRFEGFRSSFSSIYIDGTGERQIMNYRDTSLSMNADWLAQDLPDQFQAALADTRWPDGAKVAMDAARARGVPGIMDAEAPVHEALPAVEAASHVAFSAQGVIDFTGETHIETAALSAQDKLDGQVIVTDGENGVVEIVDGKPVWHAAFPIKVIDSLGAGDVWHGAFTLALGKGMVNADAIRFASAAAAIKCSRPGGRDGAPSRTELEDYLAAI